MLCDISLNLNTFLLCWRDLNWGTKSSQQTLYRIPRSSFLGYQFHKGIWVNFICRKIEDLSHNLLNTLNNSIRKWGPYFELTIRDNNRIDFSFLDNSKGLRLSLDSMIGKQSVGELDINLFSIDCIRNNAMETLCAII